MISLVKGAQEVRPGVGLATDLVTRHVSELIANGQLTRGQRLPPERELVRILGVSRTSVRAGLQSLAAKGVLVIRHGAGTFMADGPPTLDSDPLRYLAALHGFSAAEMFESRRMLEVRVAGLAAERATSADYAAMADEIASMFAVVDDPQAFLVHDIRFHRAVAAACGNRIRPSLVERVSAIFSEARRQTAARGRDRRRSAEMHRQIYQAIRNRDGAAAEDLMRDHLMHAQDNQNAESPDAPSAGAATAVAPPTPVRPRVRRSRRPPAAEEPPA
jgi:GntR family transcriptional repressor for pyruvate dehydrogenase complex